MSQRTTYTDTDAQKKVISDQIDILSPSDVPVLKYFGLNGDPEKFHLNQWPGTIYHWLEDNLFQLTDTLDGSIAADASTLDVDNGTRFKSGDVIQIDSEEFWVSGVATDTLTVSAYGGSRDTHSDGATVTIIGQARLEGDAADYERAAGDIAAQFNYTQIFQADVDVSRTNNKVSQWGISGEFDYQAAKAIPALSRLIEKCFYLGRRKAGSATTPRAFGGLDATLSTNHTAGAGAAVSETILAAIIEDCFDNGGNPDLILVNSWLKQKISGFYEDRIRTTIDESRGGVRITEVETEWGVLKIMLDRWCPPASLYVLESQYVGFLAYDAFFQEPLAKTGDGIRGQVVGEYGLVIKNEAAHGRVSNLSTST